MHYLRREDDANRCGLYASPNPALQRLFSAFGWPLDRHSRIGEPPPRRRILQLSRLLE